LLPQEIQYAEITFAAEAADRLRQMITSIQQLENLDGAPFEVFSPASEELLLVDPNHKKVFAAALVGLSLLLAAPMLLLDVTRSPWTPAEKLARLHGLPVFAAHLLAENRGETGSLDLHDPELRLLALRIQQAANESHGTVLMFSSLAEKRSALGLTEAIARCLVLRSERVLVLDLKPAKSPPADQPCWESPSKQAGARCQGVWRVDVSARDQDLAGIGSMSLSDFPSRLRPPAVDLLRLLLDSSFCSSAAMFG